MSSSKTDNFLAINKGLYPLVNFNFLLRVELIYDLPCKSVKAFTREMEYELIQEGGLNDYVHMRRKPISKPFTLEVERYAGTDFIDPLPLGADLALPVFLFVSRYQDNFLGTARTYVFTGCTVTKKTYGELQADRSGLLTDTVTIAYREMICVDSAWSDLSAGADTGKATDELWKKNWAKQLTDKQSAHDAEQNRRNQKYQEMNTKLDAVKEKEKENQEAFKAKMDNIEANRKTKQAELVELNEKIVTAVQEYEDSRKKLFDERAEDEKERKEELDEKLKAAVKEYEEKLAGLLEEREEKIKELQELREEEKKTVEEYEKKRIALLEEREELVKKMQALERGEDVEEGESEDFDNPDEPDEP